MWFVVYVEVGLFVVVVCWVVYCVEWLEGLFWIVVVVVYLL